MFTRAYRISTALSLSPATMNMASAKPLGSSSSFSFFEIKPPPFLHSVFKSGDLCVALLRTSFLIEVMGAEASTPAGGFPVFQLHRSNYFPFYRRAFLFIYHNGFFCSVSLLIYAQLMIYLMLFSFTSFPRLSLLTLCL